MNGGTQGWDRLGDGKVFPIISYLLLIRSIGFVRSNFRNCEKKRSNAQKANSFEIHLQIQYNRAHAANQAETLPYFLMFGVCAFWSSCTSQNNEAAKGTAFSVGMWKVFRRQWTVCNMHCPIPNKLICGLWHMFICFCKKHRFTQLFIMCVLPVFPSHVWLSSLSGGPTSCGCS